MYLGDVPPFGYEESFHAGATGATELVEIYRTVPGRCILRHHMSWGERRAASHLSSLLKERILVSEEQDDNSEGNRKQRNYKDNCIRFNEGSEYQIVVDRR